jgi:hypothetical protein
MLSKTKIALCTVIVLGTAFSASAATTHHRVTHRHGAIYNMAPNYDVPSYNGDACPTNGAPCRINGDEW